MSEKIELPRLYGDMWGRVIYNAEYGAYEFEILGHDAVYTNKICLRVDNFLALKQLREWIDAVIQKYGKEYFEREGG